MSSGRSRSIRWYGYRRVALPPSRVLGCTAAALEVGRGGAVARCRAIGSEGEREREGREAGEGRSGACWRTAVGRAASRESMAGSLR